MLWRTLIALLALTLSALVFARPHASKNPVFDHINAMVQTLSEITGLSENHAVPYGWMDKKQLRRFIAKRIKRTLRPEEIRSDELALKMFGLVPQDFDLRKSTIDLLTEQAAAFYDYDNKKLYLLQDSSVNAETTALAHELAHALADQHFDLGKFMDEAPSNDDENLAHTAVVEGQASWLMIAYDLKQEGKDPVPTPDMLKEVADSSDTSMTDFPVLKSSPLYIQQSLLFPYSEGTLFFDAVYKKVGRKSFAAVFEDPPVDTAQIIHPERYFAHEKPANPPLPEVAGGKDAVQITQGSVGEFDHEMMLRQYDGEGLAGSLSPHLRGGRFEIIGTGADHRAVLQYVSEWDSPEQANRFFHAYAGILKGKWKSCDKNVDNGNLLAGTGDNGYFVTRLNGTDVTSIEGLSDAGEWRRLQETAIAKGALRVVFRPHGARR
jgi:Zn-dependent peptidase ImmA (M78 family)